jgi:hypothetical protein
MNYAKPEIAVLACANSAIQGQGPSKISGQVDTKGDQNLVTNAAYEADE